MEEEVPTSPPGSWPDPDVIDEATSSNRGGQKALESPKPKSRRKMMAKDKMNERKKAAMLPAEILEQYVYQEINYKPFQAR